MARFRLTPAALSSLESIGRYTESTWGVKQRNSYLRALDKCFHDLAKTPATGRPRDELFAGLRSFHHQKHVIFYLSQNREIIIVDILHERMEPGARLRRPPTNY